MIMKVYTKDNQELSYNFGEKNVFSVNLNSFHQVKSLITQETHNSFALEIGSLEKNSSFKDKEVFYNVYVELYPLIVNDNIDYVILEKNNEIIFNSTLIPGKFEMIHVRDALIDNDFFTTVMTLYFLL